MAGIGGRVRSGPALTDNVVTGYYEEGSAGTGRAITSSTTSRPVRTPVAIRAHPNSAQTLPGRTGPGCPRQDVHKWVFWRSSGGSYPRHRRDGASAGPVHSPVDGSSGNRCAVQTPRWQPARTVQLERRPLGKHQIGRASCRERV